MTEHDSYDVVITGGAVTGSAIAWWLARLGPLRVLVVEPDPSYARSGTALSAAAIRQQFSQPLNVAISRFGVAFIRDAARYFGLEEGDTSLNFQENGYLLLAGSEAGAAGLRSQVAMQRESGAATELLDPAALAAQFPWLDTFGLELGAFGRRGEGWFDNMRLLELFRRGARAAGVTYRTDRVVGFDRSGPRISHVRLARGARVAAGQVVNAAGTRAASIAAMAGIVLPVEPRKRTVFLIDAPDMDVRDAPLMVDPAGFWIRPEGRHWICAAVPPEDRAADPADFVPDHAGFERDIWPALAARARGFETVKVLNAWAGHYAYNTWDANALLGLHPACPNLYLANGFSGHGLQQAPAVGRGIAELILLGAYRSLDLSGLGVQRLAEGRRFTETAII